MEQKKLYRSSNDRILGGVCGGIAEYCNINSIYIRVLFIILSLMFGITILFYIISLIIIPVNPNYENHKKNLNSKNLQILFGFIFIFFGSLILLSNLGIHMFFINYHLLSITFSFFLIIMGILLIINNDYYNRYDKRLTKASKNKMIFGVCSGLSNFLKIDVSIIRLFWILFAFSSLGLAVILYLTLTVILPNDKYYIKESNNE